MENIRVMTYNIQHGEGLDGRVDIERIAAVIRAAQADIVALQEVDRGVERSHRIDTMVALSELTGIMKWAFGRNIDYQGGDYGNGVLTRFPILHEQNLHYQMIRSNEQRGLLHLVLEMDGTELVVMNTHMDFRPDDTERLLNVKEICAVAEQYAPRPMIACGDFNTTPESRTVSLMKEGSFDDVWELVGVGEGATIPVSNPTKRIDYIFACELSRQKRNVISDLRLKPISARVVHADASDHLPVVAEFQLCRST
jgi:endonuclease/exonuclease/phosphatase family metal-dependent hydrolase